MRILLDTNILARAAAGPPGLANELVLGSTSRQHTLLLSPFLVMELDRVLHYGRLRPIHGLDDPEIDKYLADLVLVAEMVVPPAKPAAVVAADPQDDLIVAAAVVGKANILCTRDHHFSRPAVMAYFQAHRVQVLSDLELLAMLHQQ